MMSYATNMLDDRKGYFLCGLPYHLSIAEGLYLKEEAEDKMSESTFNEISWNMEMAAMWFGENENSFFLYDELKNARKIKECTYPKNMYDYIKDSKFSYREVSKRDNNIRIIVADIAIMGGRKNDSTSIFVIELVPIKNREQYYRNVIYTDAWEGGHSETQAIKIRRLYEQFECSYLVIDGAGVGAGVFDALVKDLVDDETQETYPAITCFNDDAMAERCKYPNADRVIFSIKANNKFNTECAMSLRDCIKRGKTRILIDEVEAEEYFIEKYKKAFYDLSPENKAKIMMPYVNTSLLINEMINLEQATTPNSGDIKLIEKSGARKDRYSALSYGNYFANLLERKIAKPTGNILDKFKMRAPVRSTNQQAVGW